MFYGERRLFGNLPKDLGMGWSNTRTARAERQAHRPDRDMSQPENLKAEPEGSSRFAAAHGSATMRQFATCSECNKMTWQEVTTTKQVVPPQVPPECFVVLMVFACGVMLPYDAAILRAVLWGGGFGFGLAVLMMARRPSKKSPNV